MDGYYEYFLPRELPGTKFPFRNPEDADAVGCDSLRAAIAQMHDAMQFELCSDSERGQLIIDRIFCEEMWRRLSGDTVCGDPFSDSETSSVDDEEERARIAERVPVPRKRGRGRPVTNNRPACFVLNEEKRCYSGIPGVYWRRPFPFSKKKFGVC
jgi:hypothetical protein